MATHYKKNEKQITVRHFLADGREVEDVDGFVVNTPTVYEILRNHFEKWQEEQKKNTKK